MEKTDMIILVPVTHETDTLNQQVERELPGREIFCCVKNVTRSEWAATAHRGLKPALCVTVWADEYEGEITAIYDDERYGVYRTYQPNSEEIELYLQRKKKVKGKDKFGF